MSVHFMFTGDNKDLLRKAQESRKEILAIDKQAKETSQSMETSFGSMGAAIAAFFTAQQASAIINKIIEVRGEFQKFKAVLSNTLGSDQKAQSAMDMLTDFASKTPFQVNELTASFVKLANQGFTPAYDEMMKLGDLASSTGKGFDQLAEAIIDAQTGEMERLKEFGIRASKDGDKVTFTFKEQQTTVDNSAKAIREYILSLGAMEGVTGANAKIAATLTGQVSNLEDSITSMYNKIGQQHEGILSDAVGGAATLVENYEEVGAALATLIVSYGAYKAVTLGLVAMERSQVNIKYTQEAAELAKLLPIKEAAINADISAAVAKGALTTAQAEGIMSLRAESAANLQSLQAVAAKAAAEKIAAKEVYKTSLERALASKQMVAQRQQELAAIMTTGNAEQIAAAKKALATAEEERHIAVKGRKIAADNLSVVSTNAESTAKAVNDVTTKSGTLSDIQATKAKGLLAIATRGLAAAFNMIKGPLIIAAIAGIAYAVYKLITADTAAEKAQKKLNEEREKAIQLKQQMTSEADGLIAKINSETETIYAQIKAYDELIKRFPELKGLSLDKFKTMPQDQQKKMIGGFLDKQELKNAEKAYEESLRRVEEIKRRISNAESTTRKTNMVGYAGVAGATEETNVTGDNDLEAALILLKGHEEELEKIKELQWQANTPIEEQIKHYEAIQIKLKEEFDALNKLQNPNKDLQSYAESMAGSWLDTKGIIENITLDSLNKQIEDTRDKLKGLRGEEDSKVQNKSYWEKKKKTADDNLGKLPDSDKGSKEWNGYLAEIQEAEKALAKYNVSTSKDATSRLKAQQELSRSILESELKLQAGRISAMEEGKAKRIALAEQEYKETLSTIQKEKDEYLKSVKDTGGRKDPAVLSTFDNREAVAGDKKNTDLTKIDKEYSEEYKERTKALTDVFLNEEQRKLAAVKGRYDKERQWADEQLKTGGMTKEEHKSYTTTVDQAQVKENYNALLTSLNDYKQQEKDLRDKWDTDINAAVEAKDAYLVARLMEGKDKALSALNGQMLQESEEWQQLFSDLDNLTVTQIDNLIATIESKAKGLKMNPVDLKEVTNSLNQAKQKVIEINPFASLGKSFKAVFKDGSKDSGDATKDIKQDWKTLSKSTEGCFEFVNDAVASCGVLGDLLGESGQQVMGMIQGVATAGIAMAAAIKTAETSSIVLAAISLALQVVTALFAAFNGDKKKEKKIKELQDCVDNLEKAYDRLGRTIENTYSDKVYALMDQQEENLRRQQAMIRQQMREEEAKKKTDKDKVNEYKDKLEEIDNQIEDSNRKQIEMWAGTDIQSAIDDFADALVDAYAQGEDGAIAMADTTKKVLANAVKEALKKKFLADALQGAVTQLGKDMEDGDLSDMDKKRFEDSANAAGERFTEAMKMYDDLFKDTENEIKDGVSGQLQAAMTEGTASQLVGLWNSTAIDMRELKNLTIEQRDSVRSVMADVKEIVKQNYLIEQNTRRGADNTDGLIDELKTGFETLDKRLGTIEKNTKSYNGRG